MKPTRNLNFVCSCALVSTFLHFFPSSEIMASATCLCEDIFSLLFGTGFLNEYFHFVFAIIVRTGATFNSVFMHRVSTSQFIFQCHRRFRGYGLSNYPTVRSNKIFERVLAFPHCSEQMLDAPSRHSLFYAACLHNRCETTFHVFDSLKNRGVKRHLSTYFINYLIKLSSAWSHERCMTPKTAVFNKQAHIAYFFSPDLKWLVILLFATPWNCDARYLANRH